MFHYLIEIDTSILFFFNHNHTDFFNIVMWWASKTYVWIPLYFILAVWLITKYRKQSLFILTAIALTIFLSDRISSGIIKPTVKRYRPTHNPILKEEIVTINNYRGGKYGFVSSHAANTFALAMFLLLLTRKKFFGYFFFSWATFVSFSRIYLGVHYPSDIIGGALLGIILAYLVFRILKYSEKYYLEKNEFKSNIVVK